MTYHPKAVLPSAVFLATKTDNHYISLKTFASKLGKITEEDVIAPEFLLTQGLRFTFDVRHPQRALEGAYTELLAMSKSSEPDLSSLLHKLLELDRQRTPEPITSANVANVMKSRIQIAHTRAKEILKSTALLTDAYFLFTPSQIWLSALSVADAPLADFYLSTHSLSLTSSSSTLSSLSSTIAVCKAMLTSISTSPPSKEEIAELVRIDKKLHKARNPEKIDLVGINKAVKREGDGSGVGSEKEGEVKKRKLEDKKGEGRKTADDLFGPALG
jgi:cyclin H